MAGAATPRTGRSARSTCPCINWVLLAAVVAAGARLSVVQQPGRGLRHRRDRRPWRSTPSWLLRGHAFAVEMAHCACAAGLPRSFLSSISPSSAPTSIKIVEGGWFPLADRARRVRAARHLEARAARSSSSACARGAIPLEPFIESIAIRPADARAGHRRVPDREPGRRAPRPAAQPQPQQGAARARGAAHGVTEDVPHVPDAERVEVEDLGDGLLPHDRSLRLQG